MRHRKSSGQGFRIVTVCHLLESDEDTMEAFLIVAIIVIVFHVAVFR